MHASLIDLESNFLYRTNINFHKFQPIFGLHIKPKHMNNKLTFQTREHSWSLQQGKKVTALGSCQVRRVLVCATKTFSRLTTCLSVLPSSSSSSSLCQSRRCSTRTTSLSFYIRHLFFAFDGFVCHIFATSFVLWSLHAGRSKVTLCRCGFDGKIHREILGFVLNGHTRLTFSLLLLFIQLYSQNAQLSILVVLDYRKAISWIKVSRFLCIYFNRICTLHHGASVPLWLWLAASS